MDAYKTTLTSLTSWEDSLSEDYKTLSGSLYAQDFETVQIGDNLNNYVKGGQVFLKEVNDDLANLQKMQLNMVELTKKISGGNGAVVLGLAFNKVDKKTIDADPYVYDAVLSEKLQAEDLAKATVLYIDALKGYTDKVNKKAQQFLDGWDKVKSNETSKENFAILNTVLDLATGFGIGTNAGFNLLTKEAKKAGDSVKDLLQAVGLRQGQIGDMLQSTINSSRTISNFNNPREKLTYNLMLTELDRSIDDTLGENGALNMLKRKVEAHQSWLEDQKYEGTGAW